MFCNVGKDSLTAFFRGLVIGMLPADVAARWLDSMDRLTHGYGPVLV